MSHAVPRLRAAALGAVLIFGAAPAPGSAAAPSVPDLGSGITVGQLPAGGGSVIVRPALGAPVAAIELWYRAPSTGFGHVPVPALARLAAQVVAASKPIVGDSLGATVSGAGGRLSIAVYADSVAVSALVPAAAAGRIVKTLTTAYFAPVVTPEGYRQAVRDVSEEARISAFDPETVARDAIFGSLFSAGPQHYPSLGDAATIGQIAFGDVRSYATRAFRSQNATLVVSGAVDASVAQAAVGGRPDDAGAEPERPAAPELATVVSPVMRTFGENGGGYGWIGPGIDDPREATAMDFIADYLFRADDGVVTRQADERDPGALVLGQFITLRDPGVMFVAYSGKDAPALKELVDAGLASVQTALEPAAFTRALVAFKYHLLSDLQTPTQIADNLGWYSIEGSAAYAPGVGGDDGTYFKTADALTPEFVASVAAKYFKKAPATVQLAPDAAGGKAP